MIKIKPKVLILCQVFYPDHVSVAQHVTDLAIDMVKDGFEVTVIAGRRAYDKPDCVYPADEVYEGVNITRLPVGGFGKKSKWFRIADAVIFLVNLFWHIFVSPRFDVVIGLTTPPLIALPGVLYCLYRKVPFMYWVMDINPDEAIEAGLIKKGSVLANILERISRFCFSKSAHIIALDRFMLKRIGKKGVKLQKISVIPPWAHDDNIHNIPHDKNLFRKEYNLMDKFVIMYSGNHSLIHPLNTLLEAALKLRNDPEKIFLFIGGGVGVQDILRFKEEHSLQNILHFPYQPREKLSYSLSAADLHVVVMGNKFVGIVHPCKIYGILAVGRPFIFIGPKESHLGDLISREKIGYHIEHGQTEDLIEIIYNVRNLKDCEKLFIQQKSEELISMHYSRNVLSPAVISSIKKTL